MARFYNTAKGDFVENAMYQPPIELMAKVIGNADQQILNNETALASLYDKLNAQGLAVDNPRLQEIMGEYKSQIDEMTANIQKDPLQFRKETGNIRNLGKTIQNNWTNGEVAAIQGNKAAKDSFVKDYIERVKDKNGGYLQQDVDDAGKLFDYQFNQKGGTNYQGPGKYNSYSTQNLNPFVDSNKIAEDAAKGWEADEEQKGYAYSDGMRINKGTNSFEIANPVEIQKGIVARIINDKPLMNYYQQQMQFYKESGGSIGMSPEAVQNSINSSAAIYASKYGYSKNKSTKDMDTDPVYMEGLRNANDLDKMYRQHELNKDLKKYEDDLSSIKEIGTSSRGAFLSSDDIKENNEIITGTYQELSNYLGMKIPMVNGKLDPSQLRTAIYAFRERANKTGDKEAIGYANKMKANFDYVNSLMGKNTQEASWASALNIMPANKVISAKKDMEAVTKDPGQLMNIKQDWRINGRNYRNMSFNDIYKSNPDMFKYIGEDIESKDDLFNQGSIRPVVKSSTDYNKNKMNMTWNIPGLEIESNASWSNLGISAE